MRKLTSGLLVVVLVTLVAGAALAAGGPPAALPAAAQERAQQFHQAMEQVRDNLQAMDQNRIAVLEMQCEVRELAQELRDKVQAILDNGLPLEEAQLEQIKDITTDLRGHGLSIAATVGQVREQLGILNQACEALQAGPAIKAYQRIQEVQETRLRGMSGLRIALEALIAELDDL